MAVSGKKIGLYATLGVTFAVLIIVALIASGVQLPGTKTQDLGTLHVSITDKPADLSNLNVTINGLFINSADNSTWIELNFTEGTTQVYFDLLALRNVNKELSVAQIPVGSYTKIRLDVIAANATFVDGTTADLKVPPGHIDVIVHFEIKTDQTTNLLIDMQPDTASISNSLNLKPVMKATVTYQ